MCVGFGDSEPRNIGSRSSRTWPIQNAVSLLKSWTEYHPLVPRPFESSFFPPFPQLQKWANLPSSKYLLVRLMRLDLRTPTRLGV